MTQDSWSDRGQIEKSDRVTPIAGTPNFHVSETDTRINFVAQNSLKYPKFLLNPVNNTRLNQW